MRKSAKKVLAAAAMATLMGYSAHAATLNWDADGVAPIDGGSGIWDTVTQLWEDGAGNYTTWNNATPDAAVFGGTVGTVTLVEAITAASLTLNTNFYTLDLNGNNLTNNGAVTGGASGFLTVTNTSGTTATFTNSGTTPNGITVSGNTNFAVAGGWTPSRVNSFTGTLHFAPTATATILPTNNNQLGSATGTIKVDASNLPSGQAIMNWSTPDGTQFHTFTRDIELIHSSTTSAIAQFRVNGVKEVMLAGSISGGGGSSSLGLQWGGTNQGNMILAGANTYTGMTTLSGQTNMLTLAHDEALGNSSGVTMGSTAQTLAFMGGITLANSNAISLGSNGGTINTSGYGNIHNLSGDNTAANDLTWGSGTTKFLGAEAGTTLTLTGVLGSLRPSEPAGITKVGYGTVVLTGENKYGHRNAGVGSIVNATVVNEGTLRFDFSPEGGPIDNIVNNNGFSITGGEVSALFLGGGTFEMKGALGETNSQQFKNNASAGFTINPGASAVRVDQNGATGVNINLGQISARNVGGTVDLTLPEIDLDTDTRKGAITIPIGTLATGGVDQIITANGAAFMTVGGTDWAGRISGNAVESGSRIADFYTDNTATTLSGNANVVGTDTTLAGGDAVTTSIRFNEAAARAIDATGQTLTTGGILITANVGSNVSTITGGFLRGQDNPSGTSNQDLVIIQNNTASKLTIGSTITNAENGAATGLTKSGPGVLELTAANTYSGATVVTGGILKLEHATAIPGGIDSAGGTANLSLKGGVIGLTAASGDFKRGIGTGAAQVQFNGHGGFAAYGGDRIVNLGGVSGSVTFGSSPAAGTFVLTGSALVLGASDSDSTIDFQNPISLRSPNAPQQREFRAENGLAAVDGRLSGVVSGDGGLTKTGAGTLELSNTNTYIGPTKVTAGTLLVSGQLIGAGSGPTVGPMSIDSGASVIWDRAANTTFLGAISGTGTMTKEGANTLVLRGASTFTGTTTINAGTLQIGHGGTSGTYTGNIINNAGLAFNRSNTTIYPGDISGPGTVTKLGAGTLNMTGTHSYAGATTINDGIVVLSNSLTTSSAINATGGTLRLSDGGSKVLKTDAVTVSGAGKIDLTNNSMIVPGGNLATLTGLIATGRAGGAWNGSGIMTSRADALTGVTGIGIDSASAGQVFAGHTLAAGDVMMAYTYVGDADLNFAIDGDDYAAIDAGYSAQLTGYANGDFNFSGGIDADDYFIIDRNYSRQDSVSLSPAAALDGVTAVPEPGSIALLSLAAVGALRRRRRQA